MPRLEALEVIPRLQQFVSARDNFKLGASVYCRYADMEQGLGQASSGTTCRQAPAPSGRSRQSQSLKLQSFLSAVTLFQSPVLLAMSLEDGCYCAKLCCLCSKVSRQACSWVRLGNRAARVNFMRLHTLVIHLSRAGTLQCLLMQ